MRKHSKNIDGELIWLQLIPICIVLSDPLYSTSFFLITLITLARLVSVQGSLHKNTASRYFLMILQLYGEVFVAAVMESTLLTSFREMRKPVQASEGDHAGFYEERKLPSLKFFAWAGNFWGVAFLTMSTSAKTSKGDDNALPTLPLSNLWFSTANYALLFSILESLFSICFYYLLIPVAYAKTAFIWCKGYAAYFNNNMRYLSIDYPQWAYDFEMS